MKFTKTILNSNHFEHILDLVPNPFHLVPLVFGIASQYWIRLKFCIERIIIKIWEKVGPYWVNKRLIRSCCFNQKNPPIVLLFVKIHKHEYSNQQNISKIIHFIRTLDVNWTRLNDFSLMRQHLKSKIS